MCISCGRIGRTGFWPDQQVKVVALTGPKKEKKEKLLFFFSEARLILHYIFFILRHSNLQA
jgi:hypothetical protein